ncbi:Neurofascin [Liparis tanakae]|uniref:Neural cell adhesion molecule L1 n=1 Tax=Liparis tanakae TaxID=230148 RepID=A0A4Z2I665_9TELE|nr:Neurofascin [Liparis tanakae]
MRAMGILVEPVLLLILWQSVWALDIPMEIRQPPVILRQSVKDHIVDPKDTMVIECEARGNPHPMRSGTLDIYAWNNPDQYEAEYQCVASNMYGSAYSNKIRLRLYRPPVWPREILEPLVVSAGLPLVLSCDPPRGPPTPETYWMSSCSYARPFNWPVQTAFPTMQPVRPDRRVSMGVNGDLYFSNILFNDSAVDYCCNARFPYKNVIQQKMPVVVKVLTTRTVAEARPTWLSPTGSSSSILVLQGEELLLECISAGVPTPSITWTKNGDRLVVSPRMKVKNFNKMIQIPKASFEDAGEYTCTATNKIGYIQHTITVRVQAAPFWLEKPKDLVLAPEENGRLLCQSDGAPRPTVSWFINGEPIENATPRIIGPKNELIKVTEGSRTLLDCRYFGSPVPELRWSKYGQGTLEGNRFRTQGNGTLEIQNIRIEDQGTYVCVVSNVAGRDESQVRLEVKEPTLIVTRPQSMKVIRGSDVRFECGVKADITTPVTTTWMKGKKPVTLGWRISLDESNLVITNVNGGDEGNYTCVIKSELDQKYASARLMVMDRPDPPSKLELSDPYERSVRLSWVAGHSNHNPITEYLVQYDDDDWLPGKWRNLSTYPGNLNSVILHLTPFTWYEFRVIAINEIGMSRPSRPSTRFQSSGAPPDIIPKNLKGVGTWRNNMEISWEPLTYREWNGPHLKYLVWWKRRDSREEWKNATTKWLRYYIYDADTFTPYDLKVQAVNDFGLGPESPVVIGYSGEDRPLTAPMNLRVSDIESTQVTLHWDSVTRGSMMGDLKEYKAYYWRDSSQLRWLWVNRGMKSKAFSNNDPEPSGVLTELIPYSNYKLYLVVANNRFEGPAGNNIHFSTPEGVPSVPTSFRIQQRHLDSIYVDWEIPAEPNGVIIGYSLKYQTVNATRGEESRVEELTPNVTSFSLRRFDRYTRYIFSVAAQTRIGIGEWHTEESQHYTTEIYAQDQVDISTQGWFIGMMCAVALIVLILLIVCFIKRSRGGKYPVREKKDISLEPVDDNDQEGSFDYRIARITTLPYPRREEERGLQRGQLHMDTMMKRTESDDSLVDYGEGGEIPFNEDGSFIGQYTGTRRDVREMDFGASLQIHSPMKTIYSLA